MIAYSITITRDTATPVTQALQEQLAPARLNEVVGPKAELATRAHFEELNRQRPNWLGGTRTNYYQKTVTSWKQVGDHVVISMSQIGLRSKYYGGRISAGKNVSKRTGRPTVFLTIPVHPRAHGHRADEFDLELVYNHNGVPVALATKSTRGVQLKQTKTGKITKRSIGRRGEIMYALKRSVMIKADPSILPAPDRIYGAAISSLNAYVDRVIARAERASS